MADNFENIKAGINLEPLAADPSNPKEGDVFRSNGTPRAIGLWEWLSGAWVQATGGTGTDGSNGPNRLENVGLSIVMAANAVTVALKQKDGSTDATGINIAKINYRGSTITSGSYNTRSTTGALSMVISSGSTLGTTSTLLSRIHVYGIDNSGTTELAVSNALLDTNVLHTTVAEGGAGASDASNVLYSTTLRSSVPIQYLGYFESTQATAGTWATNASAVYVGHKYKSRQNHFSIRITNTGTPVITSQGGVNEAGENAVASLTDNGAGDTTLNFTTGFFKKIPSVVAGAVSGNGDRNVVVKTPSTTNCSILTVVATSATLADFDFTVHLERQDTDNE